MVTLRPFNERWRAASRSPRLLVGRLHQDRDVEPVDQDAAVGLDVDDTTKFEELSRGERERVALVRALVTAPEIYLLDEPTSGLGQEETRAVLELLESTGATFVVATHDDQVMDWCHQVYELRDGNLVATAR